MDAELRSVKRKIDEVESLEQQIAEFEAKIKAVELKITAGMASGDLRLEYWMGKEQGLRDKEKQLWAVRLEMEKQRTFAKVSQPGIFERDVTYELRDRIAAPARPLPEYFQLKEFVTQPPEVRFLVPASLYLALPSQNREKIFKPATANENCLRIVSYVDCLIDPPAAGGRKANFHHLYDSLISDVMAFFFVAEPWVRVRNNVGEVPSGILCPDLVARFARLYALFRAEERGDPEEESPNSKGDPGEEIREKMEWTYGTSIPYILGYYSREYLVTFCSLGCPAGINLRHDIITLDLRSARDRVELFIICANYSRLLTTLKELCVSVTAPPDYAEFKRPNGKLVQIYGRKVAKLYQHCHVYERVLNNYLQAVGCPYAEVMLHYNIDERSLVFERALEDKPQTVAWLVECLVCVCTALVWLHGRGLMHRDIRWENVARHFSGSGWVLLDFDEACASPSQGAVRLNPEIHAPEVTRGSHNISVDIWSLGFLLATWTVAPLPADLVILKDRCFQDEVKSRPSSQECLKVLEGLVVRG